MAVYSMWDGMFSMEIDGSEPYTCPKISEVLFMAPGGINPKQIRASIVTDGPFTRNYRIFGSIPRGESVDPRKYGIIYQGEYLSRENFCERVSQDISQGSRLVLRLWDEKQNSFGPLDLMMGFNTKKKDGSIGFSEIAIGLLVTPQVMEIRE